MYWVKTVIMVFVLALPMKTNAEQKSHFYGMGFWIFREIAEQGGARAISERAKATHVAYVIIKSNDGDNWGVRVRGKWTPQFTEATIKSFTKRGIRVYAFGTVRLMRRGSVEAMVKQATRALHLGAEGYVLDDMFLFGQDRKKVETLFEKLHDHLKHCTRCKNKIVAFSTYPHILRRFDLPWDVAIKGSDYYIPQIYWQDFGTSPLGGLVYAWSNWNALLAVKKLQGKVSIFIPCAPNYDRVSAKDLDDFLARIFPYFPGVVIFRWGTTDTKEWSVINAWAVKFAKQMEIRDPSLFELFKPEESRPLKPPKKPRSRRQGKVRLG